MCDGNSPIPRPSTTNGAAPRREDGLRELGDDDFEGCWCEPTEREQLVVAVLAGEQQVRVRIAESVGEKAVVREQLRVTWHHDGVP